jgi:hypothetical protein
MTDGKRYLHNIKTLYMNDRVKSYFNDYPGSKGCAQPSDGTIFHEPSDANNYAATLDDKTVKWYNRHDGQPEAGKAAEETEPVIGEETIKTKGRNSE